MTNPDVATGRILYIDPWTGISGDMLLGALLDGDSSDGRLAGVLKQVVAALGLAADLVEIERAVEKGVTCTRVLVHGEDQPPMRHLADMERMIDGAELSAAVREKSIGALRSLAEAEAAVHGCSVDKIHFHEVGAVDTLVDVVGTFALVEALEVESVLVGPIQVGGGTVEIAHGRMGVPAPATARLLAGLPIVGGPEMRELTTPTGALLVGGLEAAPGAMPEMTIDAIGYGAGSMSLECGPNVLRVMVGRPASRVDEHSHGHGHGHGRRMDRVVELQTNVDDVSAEVVGHVSGLLRDAGALDVWTSPVGGKKDRPAIMLCALSPAESEEALVDLIFRETGTLGVRCRMTSRWIADRGTITVRVAGGEVAVKWGRWDGRLIGLAPEYEQAAAVAAVAGLPLKQVMQAATEAARDLLGLEHLLP